jgi:hypothetical protein
MTERSQGPQVDPREYMANERTFLAWIRTGVSRLRPLRCRYLALRGVAQAGCDLLWPSCSAGRRLLPGEARLGCSSGGAAVYLGKWGDRL